MPRRLGDGRSAFLYAGLPGEPAFGPPAFMHRPAAMMSPEAPITHHWLDSTHITFGVVTAGWVQGRWKLEASQFTGREPDEDRYDIERPRMDSTALRASWNPGDELVAAGVLGRRREPRAARAGGGRGADVGERALRARRWTAGAPGPRRSPGAARTRARARRRTHTRSRPPTCRRPTGSSSRAPNGSRRTSSAKTITTSTRSAKLSVGCSRAIPA